MTTYFVAVDNGNQANGYLVANGDTFVARSGSNSYGRGEIPQGNYKLGGPQQLNKSKGQNKSMAKGDKDWVKYRKFAISGVGPTAQGGGIRDARYPKEPRTGIMFHYDGNNPGTMGCIGYDDPAAQQALTKAHAAGDRDVQVIYVKNDAEARAMAKRLSGKAPPATPKGHTTAPAKPAKSQKPAAKPPKRMGRPGQRTSSRTRTRHGARLSQGEPTVVLGKKQLMAAHVGAAHDKGGKVKKGSFSVFVGRLLRPFGRVDDPTTDGSVLATGEDTVLVG